MEIGAGNRVRFSLLRYHGEKGARIVRGEVSTLLFRGTSRAMQVRAGILEKMRSNLIALIYSGEPGITSLPIMPMSDEEGWGMAPPATWQCRAIIYTRKPIEEILSEAGKPETLTRDEREFVAATIERFPTRFSCPSGDGLHKKVEGLIDEIVKLIRD